MPFREKIIEGHAMRMRQACCRALVCALLSLAVLTRSTPAGFMNGDFETGDLRGWTTSAIGGATPLISVGSDGGNQFAVFDTGDFATGPLDSILEQSFVVDPAKPFLSFDFSDLETFPDASGMGGGFPDAFAVSLDNGVDTYVLVQLNQSGPVADPFGTVPVPVALGVPFSSSLANTLSVDLSSLAGQSLTLSAAINSQDDGFRSIVHWDNIVLRNEVEKAVIPEPTSLALWSTFLLSGAVATRLRKQMAG